jgi:tRNA (guanine-N7-)-methyltransferase
MDQPKNSEKNDPKNRRRINITADLPRPNQYTLALNGEYASIAFDEQRVLKNKGNWRSLVFNRPENVALDFEMGTGNGTHFAHRALKSPERLIVGMELKYKPLIQSIRRARQGNTHNNAAICRFHGFDISEVFAENEINNVYIHFPDPWVTPKKPKNRIVNRDFLLTLAGLQRSDSWVEFKTDSEEYFDWALLEIEQSPYEIETMTRNLHSSPQAEGNFVTQFENIFLRKGQPIFHTRLRKKQR